MWMNHRNWLLGCVRTQIVADWSNFDAKLHPALAAFAARRSYPSKQKRSSALQLDTTILSVFVLHPP